MMGIQMDLSTVYALTVNQCCVAKNFTDSLSVMIEQELSKYYSCSDYLSKNIPFPERLNENDGSSSARQNIITPDDRMKIVDWCYHIVDQCELDREVMAVAMNIADRYMCTPEAHDILYHRGNYQLVIMTSLYMSIKVNAHLAVGSEAFAELSNGLYSQEEIEDMECQILKGLNWRLCCPTSLQVAHTVLSLMVCHVHQNGVSLVEGDSWDLILEEIAFQTELSIRDYYFTTRRPSTVAMAAILNAIEKTQDHDYVILITALTSVLLGSDFHNYFDPSHIIRDVMDKLHSLVNDNSEAEDCISIVTVTPEFSNIEDSNIFNNQDLEA